MISFIHTVWERSFMQFYNQAVNQNPPDNYLFKVNNRNVKTMREVRSKLAIKTPDIYIVDFNKMSRIVLVFLLLILNK